MSRGMGRVERQVLNVLEAERHMRLDVLVARTGAHPESVRRAMRSLARKGLAELGRDNGWRVIDGTLVRFWDTVCSTARLCAVESPTLTETT